MLSVIYLRERQRIIWKHEEPMSCSNDVAEDSSCLEYNRQCPGERNCTANRVKHIPPVLHFSAQDSRRRSGLIVNIFVFASLTDYR